MADVSLRSRVFDRLAAAAADRSPVSGATHAYYRYPARFSPLFAAAAIECFSEPGDVVLDPYMGGGTAVVEALRAGRAVIGNDLNSLAVFVAKVKTTALTASELADIEQWAVGRIKGFGYRVRRDQLLSLLKDPKLRNMALPRARFIKKLMAAALAACDHLRTEASRAFVRCAILRTGQWALDGRKAHTSLHEFRRRFRENVGEMLEAMTGFSTELQAAGGRLPCILRHGDAATVADGPDLAAYRGRVGLVVTSPPYPGVHVLYHRWQVDGRRETAAPYWIADCMDGQGASFYNFGDRREEGLEGYFEASLRTLVAVRRMLRPGGCIVQMVAFSDPQSQLPRYLGNMEAAGFAELRAQCAGESGRIWRSVPGRKWHATLKGATASAREVVLVHRAAETHD